MVIPTLLRDRRKVLGKNQRETRKPSLRLPAGFSGNKRIDAEGAATAGRRRPGASSLPRGGKRRTRGRRIYRPVDQALGARLAARRSELSGRHGSSSAGPAASLPARPQPTADFRWTGTHFGTATGSWTIPGYLPFFDHGAAGILGGNPPFPLPRPVPRPTSHLYPHALYPDDLSPRRIGSPIRISLSEQGS